MQWTTLTIQRLSWYIQTFATVMASINISSPTQDHLTRDKDKGRERKKNKQNSINCPPPLFCFALDARPILPCDSRWLLYRRSCPLQCIKVERWVATNVTYCNIHLPLIMSYHNVNHVRHYHLNCHIIQHHISSYFISYFLILLLFLPFSRLPFKGSIHSPCRRSKLNEIITLA